MNFWSSYLCLLSAECWDYRHVAPHSVFCSTGAGSQGFPHATWAHCPAGTPSLMSLIPSLLWSLISNVFSVSPIKTNSHTYLLFYILDYDSKFSSYNSAHSQVSKTKKAYIDSVCFTSAWTSKRREQKGVRATGWGGNAVFLTWCSCHTHELTAAMVTYVVWAQNKSVRTC